MEGREEIEKERKGRNWKGMEEIVEKGKKLWKSNGRETKLKDRIEKG